jgi:cytochrome c
MSKRTVWLLACTVASAAASEVHEPDSRLHIGEAIRERDASTVGVSVYPSGKGLPQGKGTAREGREIFAAKCAACHGDNGEGRDDFPALVGGRGSLSTDNPVLTVGSYWPTATTIFDYVWRAMPYQQPGSLNANEVYVVTAWILKANEIIASNAALDRASLLRVKMPNASGFAKPSSVP